MEDKRSDAVLSGKFATGDKILIDSEDDEITLNKLDVDDTADDGNDHVEEGEPLPTA